MNTTDSARTVDSPDYYAVSGVYQASADNFSRLAEELRQRLAKRAAEVSLIGLATALNNVAEAEGQAHGYALAARASGDALSRGKEPADQVRRALALYGFEWSADVQSGRTNDVRRAQFDGFRKAARAILSQLDA